MSDFIVIVERRIIGLFRQVENGKITLIESNLSSLISRLKQYDEASYENFIQRYDKLDNKLKTKY